MSDLITVVTSVYAKDDPAHLRQALASVRMQTYTDLEVIVVLDGPVPAVLESIVAEFCRIDDWREIVLERNRGRAAARNVGIAVARGRYLAIVDADDVCTPDRLAVQKAALESDDADVLSSPMYVIDSTETIIGYRRLPSSPLDVKRLAIWCCPLNNPAVFAKAAVLKSNRYSEDFSVAEDYDLWVRLLIAGYRLSNTDRPTVYYRQAKEALRKRRGIEYAVADAQIKIRAAKLVAWYRRPMVYVVAILTACVRCLPAFLFLRVYRLRERLVSL